MAENEKFPKGFVTVAKGSPIERNIGILRTLQMRYKDNRLITVTELEESEGFILVVENPVSSGRDPQNKMWLTKESLVGLVATITAFIVSTGNDPAKLLQSSVDKKDVVEFLHTGDIDPKLFSSPPNADIP